MRAHVGVVATLSLLAAAGVVRAATAGYEQKRQAAMAKAAEERKKLGLSEDQVRAKYPTPEVSLPSTGVVHACPGKTATMKLTGKFQPGTVFVVSSDLVQVLKEKATATTWEAEVKVNAGTLPASVGVDVIAPVSGTSSYLVPLEVGCSYAWHLELANGEVLDITTDFRLEEHQAEGAWTKGGKALGKAGFSFSGAEHDARFTRNATMEEVQGSMGSMNTMLTSEEYKSISQRQELAIKKLTACKDPKTMAMCMKAPQAELEKLNVEQTAMMKKFEDSGALKFGCVELRLTIDGTAVKGEGDKCGTANDVAVKGTVKPL